MTYWRMQLHPSEPEGAIKYTVECLSAGYVGLDFAEDIPDMRTITQSQLPDSQKNYWAFADEMKAGDWILLFAHNFPFALVHVSGEYNYVRNRIPELHVWFRHFRSVDSVKYYGDYITNALSWRSIPMPGTIGPLRDANSESFKLIEEWRQATAASGA